MSLLVRGAAFLVMLFAACHGEGGRSQVSNGDVDVRRVSSGARWVYGAHRAPGPGDWVLRSHDLRIGVRGSGARNRGERPGTVMQVLWMDRPGMEQVRSLEPLVRINDHEAALAEERFEAVLEHGHAILRNTAQLVAPSGSTLALTRDYYIEPGRGALHVVTRIENRSQQRSPAIAVGARLGWGGAGPFATRLGTVIEARQGRSPWVGLASGGVAVAWMQHRQELELTFTEESHGTVRSASATEAFSTTSTIVPGGRLEHHGMLFVAPGDLSAVSRAVMLARGEPVIETPIEVQGAPHEQSLITVTDPQGTVMLVAEPQDRLTTLPLPPGDYIAYVTATGHALGDPVRFRSHVGSPTVLMRIPPGGLIRVQVHDAATEQDLPVRIVVRGVPPTSNPMLGPLHTAGGAGVLAISTRGWAEIPVPPGTYSVVVSHGPEWTLQQSETTVTETLRGEVVARLSHVIPMEDWTACDLHVHADPSFDSRVTVEDRVASLVSEGIEFATPSEHNVVGDYSAGVAALPASVGTPLLWVPAVEVTTDRSAQPWGHFNVYPFRPDPEAPAGGAPAYQDTPPRAIFRAARQNNPDAIIQINHPRMQPNIGYFNVTGLDVRTNRAVSPEYDPTYDAIEVFNGFYLGHIEYVESGLEDWYSLLNSGARYIATGSSDSHQIAYESAGYPRTYVNARPGADVNEILHSLRQGHAFVTSGPMLFLNIEGAGPGESVSLTSQRDVLARVRVLAAPWIDVDRVDLIRNGEKLSTLAVRASTGPVRLDTEVPISVEPGTWVTAVARGQDTMNQVLPYSNGVPFAFSNPIFFVAPRPAATRPGR